MNQKIINDLLCMERRLEVRKMMAAQIIYERSCVEMRNNSPENVENSGNSRNEENGREYTIEEGKHDITL